MELGGPACSGGVGVWLSLSPFQPKPFHDSRILWFLVNFQWKEDAYYKENWSEWISEEEIKTSNDKFTAFDWWYQNCWKYKTNLLLLLLNISIFTYSL